MTTKHLLKMLLGTIVLSIPIFVIERKFNIKFTWIENVFIMIPLLWAIWIFQCVFLDIQEEDENDED